MTTTEREFRIRIKYDLLLDEEVMEKTLGTKKLERLLEIEDDKDLEWELVDNLDSRKLLQALSVILWDSGLIQVQVKRREVPEAENEDEVSDDD